MLIISSDTDTYHIGLPIHKDEEKKIVVQVSALNSKDTKLLDLSALIKAPRFSRFRP